MMAGDDGWVDVAQPKPEAAPAAAPDDGWVSAGAPKAPDPFGQPAFNEGGYSAAGMDLVKSTSAGRVLMAFGQGFSDTWGPEKLGLSDQSVQWLSKQGVFAPAGQTHFQNPFQAFNEGVMVPAAVALDGAIRTANATYRGLQEAGMAAGLHRDIVSLPDAFMGSPGALGQIKMRSGLPHDRPVGSIEPSPQTIDTPAGPVPAPPDITAFHGSPHDFDAFSTASIGTGEGAQAYGHGLYFAENEGTAKSYRDALSDAFVDGKKFDPYNAMHVAAAQIEESGSRAVAIKQIEAAIERDPGDPSGHFPRVLSVLKSDRELPKIDATGHLYQVRISADQEKMLDWDRPLSEQSQVVKDALAPWIERTRSDLKEAYGHLPEDEIPGHARELQEKLDSGEIPARELYNRQPDLVKASRELSDAGIPGIKYLDEGSRVQLSKAYREHLEDTVKTGDAEAVAQARKELLAAGKQTRNFVIFNEGDIQITHKNGEPVVTPQERLAQARDMGVIGEDRAPISEGRPEEAAKRSVMAADAKPGDKIVGPEPGGVAPNPWRERFDHFVSKLNTSDDIKQLITDAADQNNDFPTARAGDIPLQQFDDLTRAAGVDPATVDRSGIGRFLRNDDMVRNALQGMRSTTDAVKDAARAVKTDGSEANLMKLQEAMLRRDTWVEQVVGHRAEWGRTGNVFQEFQKRIKEEKGFTEWLKDQDRSPAGLKKIADSIDNLDPAQAAKFLSDANKPTFWDKFKFYWVNNLISGTTTHAKYIVANAAFAGYDAAVVTPVAGAVGTVRRAITGGDEGVFAGEAAAKVWGLVAGTPDAIRAAVQAAKTGLQTPLPGELAQGIVPKRNQNVAYQQRPIPGALGAVIGVPSKGASAIHSFFNFLGYRASIEAQAYRQAAKEGLTPSKAPDVTPVTAQELRSGRAKGESDYHMSQAAMMEPEPYHPFKDMADKLPDEANNKFQVHGLLAGDRDANLINLLENGIDPKREFHSGNPRGGTSGVDSTRTFGSPYLLVSDEGKDLRQTGVKNVVAQGPAEANLPALKAAYPNVNFMTVPEAERFILTGEAPARAPVQSNESFWQRRQVLADQPSEDMMNSAIEDGYRLTYISELGDTGKKLSSFVNSTKVGQLVMPFTHIPLNILKRAVEGTPAAWLDKETRDAMTGKAGPAKQDMAIARMVAGSAVGAWAVNQVLNERMTGFGPTDPKERAQWMATGHQPYSIRIGDEWLSFNRFGSIGTMLGLYANLSEVIPYMKQDDADLYKAIGMAVHSTGRLMEDEVGMQGLAGLMDAINDPGRHGARYISNFTGSLLPYSSLLRQTASAMDPDMRETKSVVDGLRYYIPVARQGLLPKRDWSGTPVANASYGGDLPVPGASSIIQHRSAVSDPVAQELAALDIKPAPPADRIKGVKLPPKLYDIYQSTAGPFTRTALEHYVNTPGWQGMPIGVRAEIFRRTIAATREAAGTAMQMRYPQLIQQGVEDRMNRINGVKPTKMPDISVRSGPALNLNAHGDWRAGNGQ